MPTRKSDLTENERNTIRFILSTIESDGRRPSYGEILHGTGLKSRASVAYVVKSLIAKGYLLSFRPDRGSGRTSSAETFRLVRDDRGRRIKRFLAILEYPER